MDASPPGPSDDLLQLAYVGLHAAFPERGRDELLACAREASSRMAFYRSRWQSGDAFDDVRLGGRLEARLRAALGPGRGAVICTFQIGPFLQLPFLLSDLGLDVMLLMDPEIFEFGMEICNIAG